MAEAVRVFFSYSHEDEKLRDKLAQHLSILKREGVITEWHDRQIEAGTEWANEIYTQLNNADIILLLISAAFLSSDYCWSVELKRAMARHEAGEACVIPVILRPVEWKGAPFGKLQAFPKDALPVTKWQDQDEALMNVAAGIRQAAERLQRIRQQTHDKLIPTPDDRATQQARQTGQEEALYRRDVQNCLQEDGGELSLISRLFLDGLRESLNLSPNRAEAIELELLKPYQNYTQTLKGMVEQQFPLTDLTRNRLKRLQQALNLTDKAVSAIESRILAAKLPTLQVLPPTDAPSPTPAVTQLPTLKLLPPSTPPSPTGSLASEEGIDYTRLCDLLAAQNWREADKETYSVMIRAVGKEKGDYFTSKELLNFPCTDLKTIDQLWVKYSQGKFGFSGQKEIYVECGAKLDGKYPGDEIWSRFCNRVGWMTQGSYVKYDDLKASLWRLWISPKGELPVVMSQIRVGSFRCVDNEGFSSLAQRLVDCSAIRSVEISETI